MLRFVVGLALLPQRMHRRLDQHSFRTHGAGGNRALRVLHAGAHDVLQPRFDRIGAELFGDVVHYHFGRGHTLQRVEPASTTARDAVATVVRSFCGM